MNVAQLFQTQHDQLTKLWFAAVVATYPEKSRITLTTNADPFSNPIGGMIREASQALFSALSGQEVDVASVKQSLDRLIKIRAVQTLTPSQSIGIIYLLKPILREHILPQMLKEHALELYLEIESRVDSLALLAFDMYSKDREIVAENRITEIRNQYAQLKRWAQQLNAEAPLGTFTGCGN
ncbi:MAG: RsbRD N-terminal domain-containing protein [Desulfovibrionaceae bacterium]|nr:RsbRD N-terminal domain-containing protein [Desulfovibrionaceae bacterium]